MSKNVAPTREPPPGILIVPAELDFAAQVEMLRRHRTTHALALPSVAAAWARRRARALPTSRLCSSPARSSPSRRVRGSSAASAPRSSTSIRQRAGAGRRRGPGWTTARQRRDRLLEGPRNAAEAKSSTPVVVTPLFAFATPLIRYGQAITCAFRTPRRNARPACVDSSSHRPRAQPAAAARRPAVHACGDSRRDACEVLDHREWQLVQTTLGEMTLNIVVPRPATPSETQALQDYLDAALPAHRTTIAFVEAIANPMAKRQALRAVPVADRPTGLSSALRSRS